MSCAGPVGSTRKSLLVTSGACKQGARENNSWERIFCIPHPKERLDRAQGPTAKGPEKKAKSLRQDLQGRHDAWGKHKRQVKGWRSMRKCTPDAKEGALGGSTNQAPLQWGARKGRREKSGKSKGVQHPSHQAHGQEARFLCQHVRPNAGAPWRWPVCQKPGDKARLRRHLEAEMPGTVAGTLACCRTEGFTIAGLRVSLSPWRRSVHV